MPIRSMTAFASGERSTEWGTLGCELRAVNHRFLEVGVRLPDELRASESALRERIAAKLSRGKLDLAMRLRTATSSDRLQVDDATVERLGDLARRMDGRFPGLRVDFAQLLQLPGVLQSHAVDPEALQAAASSLLDAVLDEFVAAREREGAKLAAVITERADAIANIAGEVRTLVPLIRAGQRQKLETRLAELGSSLDPGRLEQELVIWLQKLDVDEELDRLDSHVVEIRRIFTQDQPVGRRLDFLLQEMLREANTLGAKAQEAALSHQVVAIKVELERLREQVQNIE